MDTPLYREFHYLGRLAVGLAVVAVILLTAGTVVDGSAGGFLIVAAVFLLFPVLFLAGIHRMNRILLTAERLSVGGESFSRSDLDFSFGVQPPLVLSPTEEVEVESQWPLPADHELRIAGGSWGRRLGTSMIVLREADGATLVAVFTRRPQILDPLLTEWIEAVPGAATEPAD